MSAIVTTLHVIACIFLITVVLLQRGKGAQVGAVFGGGGGATMFGSRGAGNFLTKLTTGAATVFMLTSLSLSYLGILGQDERLFEAGVEQPAVAEESLFEEIGTVPAEAGTAAEEAADDSGAALEAATDEAGALIEEAAAGAGAALDEATTGVEAAADEAAEALGGSEAPSETP